MNNGDLLVRMVGLDRLGLWMYRHRVKRAD